MDGYRLFRRDRHSRTGGGVALYGAEGVECMELTAGSGTVESLWKRGNQGTNKQIMQMPSWESTTDLLARTMMNCSLGN